MTTALEMWQHAQELPEATEVQRRSKISRSYYALFSYACEFNSGLESKGNLFKKDTGSHSQLSQMLTNPTVADNDLQYHSRILGTNQKMAHELRVKADYRLDEPVTVTDLRKCLTWVAKGMAVPLPNQKAA